MMCHCYIFCSVLKRFLLLFLPVRLIENNVLQEWLVSLKCLVRLLEFFSPFVFSHGGVCLEAFRGQAAVLWTV